MGIVGVPVSSLLIFLVLIDAFETMVLPRRVTHRFRLARLYYRLSWKAWRRLGRLLPAGRKREGYLSAFGPLSLLGLFAMWMCSLMVGFALLHWSLDTTLHTADARSGFSTYLYLSGATLSTLGYGDVVATNVFGRMLTVMEAGLGFGFLACVIGYLPVLYQAFSKREVTISLLDARAGSPPSAAQLLLRAALGRNLPALVPFLAEWERWAAELLESHLSYPVLGHYRSQHDNQSWLAALTAMLDTCALLMAGVKDVDPYQAQLTFAMARHAVVDLALIFMTPPQAPQPERLSAERLRLLRELLAKAGLILREGEAADARLTELRALYEPFVNALAGYFLLKLPPVVPEAPLVDNWQTSAWTRRTPGFSHLPLRESGDDHFD